MSICDLRGGGNKARTFTNIYKIGLFLAGRGDGGNLHQRLPGQHPSPGLRPVNKSCITILTANSSLSTKVFAFSDSI